MTKKSLPFGSRVLESKTSSINGEIKVVKSLALGTYIQVEGLTQSGGVVSEVWQKTLKKVKRQNPEVRSCLILGFGGGSAAVWVKKYWSEAQVTGVDIDPEMIKLGKKYLGFGEVEIEIVDAAEFLERCQETGKTYDLVLVDTYLGESFPEKFEEAKFVEMVKSVLAKDATAVFNRLYWDEKKTLAHSFEKILEKVFYSVERFYPQANLMFICS